jgi:hypothetical protein
VEWNEPILCIPMRACRLGEGRATPEICSRATCATSERYNKASTSQGEGESDVRLELWFTSSLRASTTIPQVVAPFDLYHLQALHASLNRNTRTAAPTAQYDYASLLES